VIAIGSSDTSLSNNCGRWVSNKFYLRPGAPWQRAYVERLIGTIRRECLDHVIVFQESSLRWYLRSFVDYYHRSRTHLSLEKDTPDGRPTQLPRTGKIVAFPEVGGLHHRHERRAA